MNTLPSAQQESRFKYRTCRCAQLLHHSWHARHKSRRMVCTGNGAVQSHTDLHKKALEGPKKSFPVRLLMYFWLWKFQYISL